jgi:hypothetical protein
LLAFFALICETHHGRRVMFFVDLKTYKIAALFSGHGAFGSTTGERDQDEVVLF